jgi:hypothetical protein
VGSRHAENLGQQHFRLQSLGFHTAPAQMLDGLAQGGVDAEFLFGIAGSGCQWSIPHTC